MIREGDNFDYRKWLRRVRDEEAQAKQVPAAFSFGGSVAPEMTNLTNAPNRGEAWIKAEPALSTNSSPIASVRRQLDREARSETTKIGLRQRLVMVCNEWDDFQECRDRDAVYGYLKAVFALVVDCKGRRRTERLLRRAFQFAGLPLAKHADPFAAVIRCSCERNVDDKTISKWARALRYVAHCKKPRTPLKTFIKELGGINACAERYAIISRQGRTMNNRDLVWCFEPASVTMHNGSGACRLYLSSPIRLAIVRHARSSQLIHPT